MTTIDSKQFRNALGSFTTGVTVVTTRGVDGEDICRASLSPMGLGQRERRTYDRLIRNPGGQFFMSPGGQFLMSLDSRWSRSLLGIV